MSLNPPSIEDGTGTVRRVWRNRVIAESDSFVAEDLQEQEIIENRQYVNQLREAELEGLRMAQKLQQEEAAALIRQKSLSEEAALRDAQIAQNLLKEEALAIQRQRDEEARRSAEAVRAAMAEEYRKQQLVGTSSSSSSVSSSPRPSTSSNPNSPLMSNATAAPPLPTAQKPPLHSSQSTNSVFSTSSSTHVSASGGANVSVSTNTVVRSGSDTSALISRQAANNTARSTGPSIRYLVALTDPKNNKDIVIKNQKFQDSYIVDLKKWKDKSHLVLLDAESKQSVLEVRLLKDSKPKTYHFLTGTDLAGMVIRQPKKATKIDLILGPGVKWGFEGDFNNLVLGVTASDTTPIAKVLGKQPAADGKGHTFVLECFDIANGPLLLAMCALINVAELFKD